MAQLVQYGTFSLQTPPHRPSSQVGGALASAGRANENIVQTVTICDSESKFKTLVALLEKLMDGSRLLIFASSKKRCDELTKELRIDGW